jgi:GT2 family glycosyltransferase/glycosyltransferase involved in cell wall biosynthesis
MFNPLLAPGCLDTPARLSRFSAWKRHTPFAMAMVEALRPRRLVELGTHCGDSYCAFCQAVAALELETECFAVDTWQGDEHSGLYGQDILETLREHHDPRYGRFSQLLPMTFDEACQRFDNGSIDLLHIDGWHTYEAVSHDYEMWLPKVSQRGVILFHDTQVHERNFGVWRLWDEAKRTYEHFEFKHGYGLGVLLVGREVPEGMRELARAANESPQFGRLFEALGERAELMRTVVDRDEELHDLEQQSQQQQQQIEHAQEAARLHAETLAQNQQQLAERDARLAEAAQSAELQQTRIAELEQSLVETSEQLHERREHCQRLAEQCAAAQETLESQQAEITRLAQEWHYLHLQFIHQQSELAQLKQYYGQLRFRAADRANSLLRRVGWLHRGVKLGARATRKCLRGARRVRQSSPSLSRAITTVQSRAHRTAAITRRTVGWFQRHRRLPSRGELRMLALRARGIWSPGAPLALPAPPPAADLPSQRDAYECWQENNRWTERTWEAARHLLATLKRRPLVSIVMPVYNVEDEWLEKAVESVRQQVYPNWELCIADDASTWPSVRPLLRRLAAEDGRIRVTYRTANGNISAASNSAAELASGEYLVFLDQDDELEPNCLLELMAAIQHRPDADVIYSDDDKVTADGTRYAPQFKPDFSPELLLAYMYMTHVLCVRRELFERVGGFRSEFDGCQDYDLALRVTERAAQVVHVPKVLYHWRALPTSTASSGGAKPAAFDRGIRAVQEALQRRGVAGRVSRPEFAVRNQCGVFQIDFADDGPAVSIIIPTRNGVELLKRCIDSVLKQTTYGNYEVIVIDNGSDDPATLQYLDRLPDRCRVLRIESIDGKFNFARINNLAAEQAEGELLLFLNNDTAVLKPEWLSQMVGYAQMPGVGAVGARLLFPDGRVQHSGVVVGLHKGLAGHAFKLASPHELGYMLFAAVPRNYSAVTAACMLVRREAFFEVGGFDQEQFAVAYNDVDFCLRLGQAGWRSVCVPRAELAHHESASRGLDDQPCEPKRFRQLWGRQGDPFYNPNLSLDDEQFQIGSRRHGTRLASSQLPVRVLMASHNLNLEGAPLFQYELACGFKQRGMLQPEVHCAHDGPLAEMYREAGIPVHVFNHLGDAGSPAGYGRCVAAFGQWMVEQGFGAVHANTLVTFAAIDAARRAGLSSVWSIHESLDWRGFYQQFNQMLDAPASRLFDHPYRVVFAAEATRAMYRGLDARRQFSTLNYGLARGPVDEVLENYTPQSAKAAVGCPDDRQMVTIVGTTCERKGQLDLVQAAVQLLEAGRRDAVYYVVGCRKGDYLDELQRAARKYQSEIRLIEESDQALLYYRASDIFVCCSRNESFPRVILEAMAFGLPIVSTQVFGIAEQVRHNLTALVYEPGDIATLGTHLTRLLDDAALRQRLGAAARDRLDVLVSYDEMIQEYENLLLEAFLSTGQPVAVSSVRKLAAA